MSKLTNPLNIELERRLRTRYAEADRRRVLAGVDYDEHLVDDFIYQVHNTEKWYDTLFKTFYAHLLKFLEKGTYNQERAFKHFYNFVNRVGPDYVAEYSPGANWYDVIETKERREIAQRLLEQFEQRQELGELDWLRQ
jgi:hypothetical protein